MPLDEVLLDSPDDLARADPSGVLRALAGAGARLRRAVHLTRPVLQTRRAVDRPRAVVVAGEGAAEVAAQAVTAVVAAAGRAPVVHLAGGVLPSWVGALDLVVVLSLTHHAGPATQVAVEAGRRGSQLVTAGTADGPLVPVSLQARGIHVDVPEEIGAVAGPLASATSFWSLVTPALVLAHGMDLLGAEAADDALESVADLLDDQAARCGPVTEVAENPAKALALALEDAVPVLTAGGPLAEAVVARAGSALARLAGVPVAVAAVPPSAGDVVALLTGPFGGGSDGGVFADPFEDAARPRLRLVVLDPDTDRTVAHLIGRAEQAGVRVSEVPADASGAIGRLAQTVAMVDFAAAYLALGSGRDPAAAFAAIGSGL